MSEVTLAIYDLSQGMARQFSMGFLGKQIDGIWHTGIRVYGKEYFFGGGIQALPPQTVAQRYGMMPVETKPLGRTTKTLEQMQAHLTEINHRFTQETYDLLNNNCNNFSHALCTFLLGHGIPQHIIDLPREAMSSPIGKQ